MPALAKIAIRFVVLAALVLAPVSIEFTTAAAAKLPWTTFSGAVSDVTHATPAMCAGGEIVAVSLVRDGVTYAYWAAVESGRIVFVVSDAAGQPAEVGLGTVDADKHDVIPALVWARYDPAVHRGPCSDLFPADAKLDTTRHVAGVKTGSVDDTDKPLAAYDHIG